MESPAQWSMGFRRVFLADVAATSDADATPLRRSRVRVERVQVQGLCVWRESVGAQLLRVEIDDGTDVALLQLRGEAAMAELQEVQPGTMVRALGEVQDAPLFASGRSWKRWIDAASVGVMDDPNAESLHVLETLLVQKAIYLNEKPHLHAGDVVVSSIPLLPFPDAASEKTTPTTGTKRKLADPETPTRPSQPVLLEMKTGPGVLNQPRTALPPAEYQFHVSSADLKLIASGAKKLEMRLNNPPYSIIRVNDRIKFNSKIVTTVKAVRKYAQLRSALELESVPALLPLVGGSNLNTVVRHLRQFISEAEEKNHGVAVFEIEPPVTASATQRTPEEWSKLIYDHIAKGGSTGCTLRDLQFAFPSLAVDKMEAMLTDLQMDAVIYLAKGTYRLV